MTLVTMSETSHQSKSRAAPPVHLEPTSIVRPSHEISPSRSSLRSSSSQSQAHTPSSSVPSTPLLPTRLPSPEKKPPHPDSNSFLTALAAQERRVLELREELLKADEDLEKLKKQWAVHEATKKKNELRHLQQLQPLNAPSRGSCMPSNDNSARASRAFDGRRITPSSTKPSRRKLFAGSRHTQALSLLSPRDPRSHPHLLVHDNGPSKPHRAAANYAAVPAIVPELPLLDVESGSDGPQKEVILETGKQLVGDFRQGLWTFFEDFKQLTVGDEGIGTAGLRNPPVIVPTIMPRRPNMKEKRTALQESLATRARTLDVARGPSRKPQIEISGSSHRVGTSLDRPAEAVDPNAMPDSEGGNNANSSDSDDNGWEIGDSPKESTPRSLGNGADPMASPLTYVSSPRTSMR